MKILFIASGYLPYTFSENLCNAKLVYALQEAGWHVDVISKKDNGPTYSTEWQEPWLPLKEHTYEISYFIGGKLSRLYDLLKSSIMMGGFPVDGIRWARRAYQKALELHRKNHYDVVITRSPSDIPHIVGYKFSKKVGIKWIANWNDPASTIWPEPYTHHFSKKAYRLRDRYNKLCLCHAAINTFPSSWLLEHFQDNYPLLKDKRNVVIPHIAMPDSLYHQAPILLKDDKLYMCHSGNLSSERNPELMFKAIRELIHEGYTSMKLEIMGHINDYTQQLIEKYALNGYVSFIGGFPYLEALRKMQFYHVFVLLEAKMEKGIFFPSKFTDYAQLNRPILAVSPKDGFAKEMLSCYGGGIAADNEDYRSIKSALLKLYQSWKQKKLFEEYNTNELYQNFSARRVVELYKTLLS